MKHLEIKISNKIKNFIHNYAEHQAGSWSEKRQIKAAGQGNNDAGFNPKLSRTRSF